MDFFNLEDPRKDVSRLRSAGLLRESLEQSHVSTWIVLDTIGNQLLRAEVFQELDIANSLKSVINPILQGFGALEGSYWCIEL
jgi:hypothetical protein